MCAAPCWGNLRTDSTVYGMLTKTLATRVNRTPLNPDAEELTPTHNVSSVCTLDDVESLRCGADMHCYQFKQVVSGEKRQTF